jgi:hypothetical protein
MALGVSVHTLPDGRLAHTPHDDRRSEVIKEGSAFPTCASATDVRWRPRAGSRFRVGQTALRGLLLQAMKAP